MHQLSERRESLWILAMPPTIWAAHFLVSYVTAAVWCAKVGAPFDTVRTAIAVYTVVALVGIGFTGWRGARRHRRGSTDADVTGWRIARRRLQDPKDDVHDSDTPEDRYRFLGFASLLLAGLSAVATIFVALTAVFIETCN